jgi:hypothetical protein
MDVPHDAVGHERSFLVDALGVQHATHQGARHDHDKEGTNADHERLQPPRVEKTRQHTRVVRDMPPVSLESQMEHRAGGVAINWAGWLAKIFFAIAFIFKYLVSFTGYT